MAGFPQRPAPRGPVTNRAGYTQNPADQPLVRGPILNRAGQPQAPVPGLLGSAAPAVNPTNPNNAPSTKLPAWGEWGGKGLGNQRGSGVAGWGQAAPGGFAMANAFGGKNTNPAFDSTTAPYGMDMTAPGVVEQKQQMNEDKWSDPTNADWIHSQVGQMQNPGVGETGNTSLANNFDVNGGDGQEYWEGVQGRQNFMHGYTDPANAQSAFDQLQGALPGSLQPQFDAYYDRGKEKAMSSANAQGASRGVYGSSGALNGVNSVATDWEAQRAKDSTQFSLDDSANQRAWMDSLSGAGSAADTSSQGAYGQNVAGFGANTTREKTYADIAFASGDEEANRTKIKSDIYSDVDRAKNERFGLGVGATATADQIEQGRLQGGFNEAHVAQDAREGRVNGLYDATAKFGTDVQNFVTKNYDTILSGDQAAIDQLVDAELARKKGNENWSDTQEADSRRGITDAIDTVISLYKGGDKSAASGLGMK